jgi:hypothetical protein
MNPVRHLIKDFSSVIHGSLRTSPTSPSHCRIVRTTIATAIAIAIAIASTVYEVG